MKREPIQTAPFVRHGDTVPALATDVIIALIPAWIWGAYAFGARVLTVTAVCVLFCLGFQEACARIFHKQERTERLLACLSGLMLAMILPVSAPLWVLPVLCLVTVLFSADALGGIGKGFVPSLAASKILYFACLPSWRGHFPLPFVGLKPFTVTPETEEILAKTVSLTPLLQWRETGASDAISLSALLTGSYAACTGEAAALLLLTGLGYLLVRRTITWHVPVLSLVTALVLAFLFPRLGDAMQYAPAFLLSGGMILCCGFLAPLFGTAPATRAGKSVYGVLLGVLCVLARFYLSDAMGAYFALFAAGALAPWIDRLCAPLPFGAKRFAR